MNKQQALTLSLAGLLTMAPAMTQAHTQTNSSSGARVATHKNNLNETFHKGKRCSFTKLEAIITGVGWFVGVIPGAVLTPLACKKNLFK